MKTKQLLLVLIILYCSCGPIRKSLDISTTNVFSSSTGLSFEKITLYNNQTFDYSYIAGLIDANCKGDWTLRNDSLYLSTYSEFEPGIIAAKERVKKNEGQGIVIEVLDDQEIPLARGNILINDDAEQHFLLEMDGKAIIPSAAAVNKITVSFLGENYHYTLKNKKANYLQLLIRLTDLSKCYKYKEWYLVGKNKLTTADGKVLKRQ